VREALSSQAKGVSSDHDRDLRMLSSAWLSFWEGSLTRERDRLLDVSLAVRPRLGRTVDGEVAQDGRSSWRH
jgi:hypothetical protein